MSLRLANISRGGDEGEDEEEDDDENDCCNPDGLEPFSIVMQKGLTIKID